MKRIGKSIITALLSAVLLMISTPLMARAEESIGTEENPWRGRSAVFVGDSITAGVGTTKRYDQFLEESLDLGSVTTMGVGGSCISAASDYGQNNQPLINRYQNIPSADLIVIFMGTNDYGHETPLGSAGDTRDGTFYGALNIIVPTLVEMHPSGKIVFVTPLHRYGFGTSKILGTKFTYDTVPNGVGASLGDYVNALKDVCAKNSVSVIDLYDECTWDPSDPETRAAYIPDGIHPNAAGHEVIAGMMASHILSYTPSEKTPIAQSELIYGNKFATGYTQTCRASSRVNYYLKAGTVITLKNPAAMQWACAKTSHEYSSDHLGYFPDKQWTDKESAVVAEDSWVGFVFKYRDETRSFDLTSPLSDYITIEEPHVHAYRSTVTAPTCTKQGYTTYTCACGESYVGDYVEATGHTYQNGICTGCGAAHPNKARYEGKVISILGDSISTFDGYIPVADGFNLKHYARYPQDNLFVDVEHTWWMQVLSILDAHLGINESWRSTEVYNYIDAEVNSSYDGTKACMASTTRIRNLGSNGTPDVILFYGGTNDITQRRPIGSFDAATAPTEVDLVSLKWNTVADAYVDAIMRMQHYYPDAEIVAMLPTFTYKNTDAVIEEYNSVFGAICEHYGVPYVDLRGCGISTSHLPDGTHPDAVGMDYITAAVLDVLMSDCHVEAGEHIVHSVTHNLTDAESSLSYYKGISHGKPFVTTITGENVKVSVTMDGADITADCYADGVITIEKVSGDVVITAKGVRKTIYEDYLQELPKDICSDTNLWIALKPINLYYTTSGWGHNASSTAYSVTIPIFEGDRLWATSFQKSGTNGGTGNGIRLTWFNEEGVLKSLSPQMTYEEFAANGYLTAPDGTVAVNVVMWNGSENNEVYLLNRPHTYQNGLCTGCGAEDPDAVTEPLSLRYDDRCDVSGKTVEIVDGKTVIAVENDTLRAVGIGRAKVRIDGVLYEVSVTKAKINIVVIMGQSNAGNHFANATSDVTCPPGTAYWWKHNATEPVDYTQPSMGFHTPLLAELYAQSAAAGDPIKNVMVWQEGVTSKNGQSIVKWAASETDTSGTDGTAAMIRDCIDYYEKNSDRYEIVNCGVYWLQGESDVSMAPETYTGLFMAMWNQLKDAGAEYMAFFRVRCGTTGNGADHQDLAYTGSLIAQLQMVNQHADMFMASTVTEAWVGDASTEHSVDIRNYITLMEEYGREGELSDSYGNAATFQNGVLTTTMKTLYGSNNKCHYGKFGYGIIGADAAYHMYAALRATDFSIVKADTSGSVESRLIGKPGDSISLDITNLEENLAFRASCGSVAGTLRITVKSGEEDITDRVIAKGTSTFGMVDTGLLRQYSDPVIIVTYTPVRGTAESVTYQITDNTPAPPDLYYWDFETDLYARDANGEIVNGFGSTALQGSYALEDGSLKAVGLHLALEKAIRLDGEKNWSMEWKLGKVTEDCGGFLFSSKNENVIGNKAIYHVRTGQFMISDYADKKGYRNYTVATVTVGSGDVLKMTNRFDPEAGRSILSLWQNGILVIEDFRLKGSINGATSDLDMTPYPLSGDFSLRYMGAGSFATVTEEIEYIRIIPDVSKLHTAHKYEATVTAPTCTERGYTTYTCACGDSYVGDYVEATGHTYQNGICTGCGASETPRMYGDVDGNGEVNPNDAVYILRYAAGLDRFDEVTLRYADANGDGEVDERDAVVVLRHAAGFDEVLGGR